MRARTATVLIGAVFASTAVHAAMQLPATVATPAPETLLRPIGLFDWLFGGSEQSPAPQSPSRPAPRDEEELPRPLPQRHSRALLRPTELCAFGCAMAFISRSVSLRRAKSLAVMPNAASTNARALTFVRVPQSRRRHRADAGSPWRGVHQSPHGLSLSKQL